MGKAKAREVKEHMSEEAELLQGIRLKIMERDMRVCQVCGGVQDLDVHMIYPPKEGVRLDDPLNLITLCRRCHEAIAYAMQVSPPLYYRVIAKYLREQARHNELMVNGGWI